MKTPRFLLLVLAALFAVMTPRPAEARAEVSFDFFYDSLSPYGEWLQVADYGYCWRPTDMDPDWTPYSDGYWAYTDAGWTWVSYEDFGGIVYHYGRWVRVEDEGWCWTPDYEWGPAWVSWRNSDEYVGWAPLPPEARWQPSVGISIWVDRDCDIGPSYYNFCRVHDFGAPVLRPVIINRIENITIIRRTVNITNITYNTRYSGGPIIFNGGPNFVTINQRSGRRIPALKLVQNVNIDMDGIRGARRGDRRINFNGQTVGNQLIVTAPGVKPPTDPGFLKQHSKKVVAMDKVSRGWDGVKNDEVRKELKQEMQRQTKGLTRETAPAKAMAVSDLKVLPEKADPKAPSPVATREKGDRPGDGRPDDGRPEKGKKGKTADVPGQPSGPGDAPDPRVKPTVTIPPTPDTDDKTPGKGRGPMARDGQKPGDQKPGEPGLKPFNPNPVTETDQPGKGKGKGKTSGAPGADAPPATPETNVTKPGNDPAKMRDAAEQQQRQAEIMRQRQEAQAQKAAEAAQQKAAEAAEQDKARKQAESGARMQQQKDAQREALRQQQLQQQQQQQQQQDGARQRMQADQEKAARAAAQQQKQAETQQKQAEMQRRQVDDQKAAEQQQRRQAMEQQKQQREADQGRRNQDAQREQMRQQQEAARAAREAQRAQQQQNQPPAGGSDSDDGGKKKKKKDQ